MENGVGNGLLARVSGRPIYADVRTLASPFFVYSIDFNGNTTLESISERKWEQQESLQMLPLQARLA